MTTIDRLKRQHSKMLRAIVRRVQAQRRLHRYIPHEDQFVASAAKALLKERSKRR